MECDLGGYNGSSADSEVAIVDVGNSRGVVHSILNAFD